jgi:hypothetical protein
MSRVIQSRQAHETLTATPTATPSDTQRTTDHNVPIVSVCWSGNRRANNYPTVNRLAVTVLLSRGALVVSASASTRRVFLCPFSTASTLERAHIMPTALPCLDG